MIVVAFGHKSRVGKDTASKFLVNTLRQTVRDKYINHSSFASHLKVAAQYIFKPYGIKSQSHYDSNPSDRRNTVPELNISPVDLWIKVGMFVRSIHPDAWVRLLLETHKKDDILIISDLRFQNEIECIRKLATYSIICKINNNNAPVYDSPADTALDGYTGWDTIIENNGTMEQFYESVNVLAKLVERKI